MKFPKKSVYLPEIIKNGGFWTDCRCHWLFRSMHATHFGLMGAT